MNASQLQCCIDCDPVLKSNVVGVFAADQLPRILSKHPSGFIVNTDISSKPGQHWCSFYIEKTGIVEFFDSYGRSAQYYSDYFKEWIVGRADKVKYNSKQIQSDYSNVCGLYSLHYIRQRLIGRSMEDIVNTFDTMNLSLNDIFIYDYMTNVYSMCMQNVCVYNQSCRPLIKM